MKRIITLSVAAAFLLTSMSAFGPKRSEAALGIAFGNLPLFVVGAVFITVDTPVFVTCGYYHCWSHTYGGGPLAFLGIILLDSGKDQTLGFGALDPQRSEFGTPAQIEEFNHALPYINAVRDDIQGNALERVLRGQTVRESELHAAWQQYRPMFAPGAYAVLEKVSAQAAPEITAEAQP